MKRLQNPKMVDEDDRNDMENMENMEYEDEDENNVLKTMENNLSRKTQEKIQEDVDRSYGNS